MRYPIVTLTRLEVIARQRLAGLNPSVNQDVQWLGTGDDVQLQSLEELGRSFATEALEWTDPDRDRFEGIVAGRLYAALQHVPVYVLDDPGFWRFLAVKYFWEFIHWREEKPFMAGHFLKYLDGTVPTESVLNRMYLRAQALGGVDGCNELGGSIPKGTDFWRSHIVRVRTGTSAPLTRAFARKQANERLNTKDVREVAKRLNRTWTNVVLNLYSEAEAQDVVESVWVQKE